MPDMSSTSRDTPGVGDNYTSLAPGGEDHPYDIIPQQPQDENTHRPGQNKTRAPKFIQGRGNNKKRKTAQATGNEGDSYTSLTEREDHPYEVMARAARDE